MFGYYSPRRRRSSSHQSPPLIIPPSTTYHSSAIHESPKSASSTNSHRQQDLGSPFSLQQESLPPLSPVSPTISTDKGGGSQRGVQMASGGSREPLVAARDYGMPERHPPVKEERNGGGGGNGTGGGQGAQRDSDLGSRSNESFMILPEPSTSRSTLATPPPTHSRGKPLGDKHKHPLVVPPPSVHDSYVSNFILPLDSPSGTGVQGGEPHRPPIHRSSSAPGRKPSKLLPSALPSPGVDSALDTGESETSQPIFEIFNAELAAEGDAMSKKLRRYLEVALKGQEDVGRMHLELEGLGEKVKERFPERGKPEIDEDNEERLKEKKERDEKFGKRERGVDEIMRKLDSLSETLRSYHHMGTPKLSFQQPNQSPVHHTRDKPRTQSIDVAQLPPHQSPSRSPSSSSRLSPPSLVRSSTAVDLSPMASLRGQRHRSPLAQTFQPESDPDDEDAKREQSRVRSHRSKGSDLSPLRLEDEEAKPLSGSWRAKADELVRKEKEAEMEKASAKEAKPKSFWDREQEREREKGMRHQWLENADTSVDGERERVKADERVVESPVDIGHQKRPW
ncbi:hypothetical protein IAT38_000163 [Cryptococcus sp. DSM 104549]